MGEQRALERKYATLIQHRGELRGLSNKHRLEDTKVEIQKVAKALKDSTRTLCRVLKDNPDVAGNLAKIKRDKHDLCGRIEELLLELKELSYQ